MSTAPTLPPLPADLDKLTDAEINVLVAKHVVGLINQGEAKGVPALAHRWFLPSHRSFPVQVELPDYCGDANEVISVLECGFASHTPEITPHRDGWVVVLHSRVNPPIAYTAVAPTLARAAALALLRASAAVPPLQPGSEIKTP